MPILYRGDQRVLFVHVPKSAGTSVALWFAENDWRVTNLELQSEPLRALFLRRAGIARIECEGQQPVSVSPQHASRDVTRAWGPFTAEFAVVREPLDRLLAHVRWLHGRASDGTADPRALSDFANAYLADVLERARADPTVADNHIRPQVDLLDEGVEVLHYESDWATPLARRFGLAGDVPAVHAGPPAQEPIELERRVARRVLSLYGPDYERLGYPLPTLGSLTRGRGPGPAARRHHAVEENRTGARRAPDDGDLPEGRGRRIVFLWTKTLLDRRSGASINLKAALEALAAHGFDCHAVSMTMFDGTEPFPLAHLIGEQHADPGNQGRFLQAPHRGICHWLYVTSGTVEPDMTAEDVQGFAARVPGLLERLQPDLVVTTGSGSLAEHLHGVAHRLAPRTTFFLANPHYRDPRVFEAFDAVVCPSQALADHYRKRVGVHAGIMRDVFAPEHFVSQGRPAATHERRRSFVTMVNPSPEKGAVLFFRLLELARRERPDLRFLAVEGRVGRAEWARVGLDPADFPNLVWVRNRRDMRPVYRRSAALLCPSLWFEPSARVVAEAQLSGVPVVATDRGGLPEQLNGGGQALEPPAACVADWMHVPTRDEVRPWLEAIAALVDDPDVRVDAARRARAAAVPFHPDARIPELVREFDALAGPRR